MLMVLGGGRGAWVLWPPYQITLGLFNICPKKLFCLFHLPTADPWVVGSQACLWWWELRGSQKLWGKADVFCPCLWYVEVWGLKCPGSVAGIWNWEGSFPSTVGKDGEFLRYPKVPILQWTMSRGPNTYPASGNPFIPTIVCPRCVWDPYPGSLRGK